MGQFRVTVTFYDRVRTRWFKDHPAVLVGFTHDKSHKPYFIAYFFRNRAHNLKAQLCESGSNCGPVVGVARPNATTIRASFTPLYGQPDVGFFLMASTKGAAPSSTERYGARSRRDCRSTSVTSCRPAFSFRGQPRRCSKPKHAARLYALLTSVAASFVRSG